MRDSGAPNVLLVTRTPPGHAGAGGMFLQELWQAYPPDRIHCFTVARETRQLPDPEILGSEPGQAFAPRNLSTGRLGALGGVAGSLVRAWHRLLPMPRLLRDVARFALDRRVDLLWVVLNDPATIRLAAPLAKKLALPLVLTVWDPPEAVAGKAKLDRRSQRSLLRHFKEALELSRRCGVASEGMAEEYRALYGVEPIVQIHGLPRSQWKPPSTAPSTEGLTLGFAGSIYTDAGWRELFEVLDSVDWQIAGKPIRVKILGHGAKFLTEYRDRIDLLGWRSVAETIETLAGTDVTYLPYWFTESHAESFRLCFPNKLTAYLAAGNPVFYHGPQGSSPDRFFDRFPAAACCYSRNLADIRQTLFRLFQDPTAYAEKSRAGRDALQEELGLHVFRRRFAALLGVAETALVPLELSEG